MSTHAAVVKKFINDPDTVVPEALAGTRAKRGTGLIAERRTHTVRPV